eukprot:Gb_30425 [translate_table: standard]
MDSSKASIDESSCTRKPLYSRLEQILFALGNFFIQINNCVANVLKISSFSALMSFVFGKGKKVQSGGQTRMNSDKSEFLKVFGEHYGYPGGSKSIDVFRDTEFKRLNGLLYLDHAGATLYSESQMQAIMNDLTTNIYGNPHSQNDSSVATSDLISSARQQVLAYCNASSKDYKCIFTSGATAALKLVGETFPWTRNSHYVYTMENHNSVLGIREYALNQGAAAIAVDTEGMEWHSGVPLYEKYSTWIKKMRFCSSQRRSEHKYQDEKSNGDVYNLFAFPLECNFSGAKFDLELVKLIHEGRHVESMESVSACRGQWMVLLDAAKGCGTQPPNLSEFPADFVVLSFYKIFGYPTGLGALIVRTEAAQKLQKSYFGGGTVAASIADIDFVKKREGLEQRFEDGTVSFLSIATLQHGFRAINQLGISNITRHTGSLTAYTSNKLAALRHSNGVQVCVLYGRHNIGVSDFVNYWGPSCQQGPVVTFNLKRSDGSWVGYREVERLAAIKGIQLRTGCFCNPGACSKYLELTHTDLRSNFESGHVCWDDHDVISGRPTGAVRVSFGYMSTFEDAQGFVCFIDEFFVSKLSFFEIGHVSNPSRVPTIKTGSSNSNATKGKIVLDSITIYPIKSCAGFHVEAWPLSNTGLLYDREWLVMSASGEALSQKRVPLMCSIGTFIDRAQGKLFITSPNIEEQLQIPLQEDAHSNHTKEVLLCSQRSHGRDHGAKVNEWFTKALGCPCTLIRRENNGVLSCRGVQYENLRSSKERFAERNYCKELSFVNEGQLLLVSRASVNDLNSRLESSLQVEAPTKSNLAPKRLQVGPMRFRPNLVISGAEPYEEDNWQAATIGKEYFTVLGGCNRCQMINIDPQTGLPSKSEPLSTLASYRRVKGKILFGVLLMHEQQCSSMDLSTGTISDYSRNQDDLMLKVGHMVIPERIA